MTKAPDLITNFDDFDGPNQYRFLSNFYIGEPLHVFEWDWMTGEHAFAGMKTNDLDERRSIQQAVSPGAAKSLGRKVKLRDDWEEVKYDVMMAVVRTKFTMSRDEGFLLLATKNALLVEGTGWGDHVWGTTHHGHLPNAQGRNWLGTMLMARRAELRAFKAGAPDYSTGMFNERFAF